MYGLLLAAGTTLSLGNAANLRLGSGAGSTLTVARSIDDVADNASLTYTATLADGKVNPDAVNANLAGNIDKLIHGHTLWLEQLKAIGVTLALAIVGTIVIAYIVKAVIGLRPAEEVEVAGLDLAEHGEEGYHQARG